jgi:hypothetical protein
MTITIEKNQGIRLQLASAVPTPLHISREAGGYYKVRSYHGGGEFFQPENAQIILQCLGEFLPRAVERPGSDGRPEIFYQHLINGQDVSSRTAPLDSGVNVPKVEITRLEAAIAQLKAKENDPGTDPTKREIIRAFRLPSPQKDHELYRLYTSGGSRRLLVLWGVEKEAGSSLAPHEALQRVPQSKSSIPWWYWLLLAILLLLLLGWWRSFQQTASTGSPLIPGNDSPAQVLSMGQDQNGNDSKGTRQDTSGGGTPIAASADKPAALVPVGGGDGNSSNSKDGTAPPSPVTSSNPQPPSTLTSRRSNTPTDDSKPAAAAAKTAAALNPSPNPATQPPPNMPSTPLGGAPKESDSTKSEQSTPVSKAGPTTPPPPSDASAPKSSMASEKQTPPSDASTPSAKAPPAQPLSAEIVNARTSAAPKDGKVEMQLSMLARDADGKAITISKVEAWSVDGKPQLDLEGHPITTNGLPVNLTEGVHRVRVIGTAADGRPVAAEADVNVDIAVRQESTVRVKQVGKP